MEAAAHADPNLRLRRIDIGSFGSDVARQHSIQSLPALVLYRGEVKQSEGVEPTLARLARGL